MPISELIRVEELGKLSFGNHLMESKRKITDFEVGGDLYKIKTFHKFTKLEKNGKLLYESEPGTTVYEMELMPDGVEFYVEGIEPASITVELENDALYNIYIDNRISGSIKSTLSGKINFSVDFDEETKRVKIVKG